MINLNTKLEQSSNITPQDIKLEEFKNIIACQIDDYLVDNKMSVEDLARKAGITYYDLFLILNRDDNDIKLSTLAQISHVIDKDLISFDNF